MKKIIIMFSSILLTGIIYFSYPTKTENKKLKSETQEEFISYTLNGSTTDKSYEELVENNKVNSVTCENGSTAVWSEDDKTIKLSNISVPDYCTIDFSTEGLTPQFIRKILADNPTISERTDFSVTNTSNTTGTIYKTNKTEDGSYVYYYSGNTTNNWVYFGGFYWRIIRTNEDGSVRLLYAGTSHDTTTGYIGTSAFNSSYIKESKYAGYMYGGNTSLTDNRANTTSSTIKGVIDTWYQNNLLTNYDKYISKSAIYCNDRSVGSGTWVNTEGSNIYYGAYTRLDTNKAPNYKCGANTNNGLFESTQAVADKFSVSTSGGGNGDLTYGIALMTADEIAFAGGVYSRTLYSPHAYFFTNSAGKSITYHTTWWLLSPWVGIGGGETYNSILYDSTTDYGQLNGSSIVSSTVVRPVVSLSSCTQVTGTGTPTDPYVIDEINSTCS